jgi:AraC-like DNA-binding protein
VLAHEHVREKRRHVFIETNLDRAHGGARVALVPPENISVAGAADERVGALTIEKSAKDLCASEWVTAHLTATFSTSKGTILLDNKHTKAEATLQDTHTHTHTHTHTDTHTHARTHARTHPAVMLVELLDDRLVRIQP